MIAFCMMNGGMYRNINEINNNDIKDMSKDKLIDLLQNTFISIRFEGHKEAIIRCKHISSVNLD